MKNAQPRLLRWDSASNETSSALTDPRSSPGPWTTSSASRAVIIESPMLVIDSERAAWLDSCVNVAIAKWKADRVVIPNEFLDLVDELRTVARGFWRSLPQNQAQTEVAEVPQMANSSHFPSDDVSTAEAAEVLGISERGARALIASRRLEARKIKGAWRVSRLSVELCRSRREQQKVG